MYALIVPDLSSKRVPHIKRLFVIFMTSDNNFQPDRRARLTFTEPEARKRLAGGEGRGATGNHRKRTAPPSSIRDAPRQGREKRSHVHGLCCPPDPACPSRALPGRGGNLGWWGVLFRWLHHRLISGVPPARTDGDADWQWWATFVPPARCPIQRDGRKFIVACFHPI
jgi:hypothetical protein